MKKNIRHIDPEVPEGVGNVLSEMDVNDSFSVPKGYFEENADRLKSLISIEADHGKFDVPEGYFEKSKTKLLSATTGTLKVVHGGASSGSRERKIYHPWLIAGVAASLILGGLFLFSPGKHEVNSTNFASLLEQTEILPEDLEYFAEDEDYYELYLLEVESDTLTTDSLVVPSDSLKVQPIVPTPAKVNDEKKNTKEAPKKKISIDELTDDEILDYLLEEGDDDFWNDL